MKDSSYNEIHMVWIDPLNRTYKVKCPYCKQCHKHGGFPKDGDVKLSHCLDRQSQPYTIRVNEAVLNGIPNQYKIQKEKEIKGGGDCSEVPYTSDVRQKRKYVKRLKHNLF